VVVDQTENITDDNNAPYDPFGLGTVDEVFVDETPEATVTTPDEKVKEKQGMSSAAVAFTWLFIIFIIIPLIIVLACFMIVQFFPESKPGQKLTQRHEMFKEMMAKRKERNIRYAEEKEMYAL